jgi:GLPGLI family protein
MKAVYEDTIKNQKITAWFAQDLPLPLGPENYFGLPGLILEVDVNNGCVVITAEKIEFVSTGKDVKIPKSKGKKVSQREINDMTARHIKDSMKAQRNPYWAIRY